MTTTTTEATRTSQTTCDTTTARAVLREKGWKRSARVVIMQEGATLASVPTTMRALRALMTIADDRNMGQLRIAIDDQVFPATEGMAEQRFRTLYIFGSQA